MVVLLAVGYATPFSHSLLEINTALMELRILFFILF